MIRAVGKQRCIERTTTTAVYRFTPVLVYSRPPCGHASLYSSSARPHVWRTSSPLITPFSTRSLAGAARLYGTKVQPQAPKSDKPAPPPPIPVTVRKPKVDLRPGPVKVAKQDTSDASRSSTPAAATKSETTKAEVVVSKTPSSASVIQSAKEDLADAAQHGILKPPPRNASWAGRLFHQAKELFKFYWSGLKLINTHRKRVREMRLRVQAGGEPLSRWETRFIRTHSQDVLKLVPFLLIVLILEEVIPLIVLYAPFLLPSTCILPSQRQRIENKKLEKQRQVADQLRMIFELLRKKGDSDYHVPVEAMKHVYGSSVAVCGILQLSTFGPDFRRRGRILQHLQYLAIDDALLVREGMGERLTRPELLEALAERGIVTEGLNPKQIDQRLKWWLTNVNRTENGDADSRRLMLIAKSGAWRW